MSCWSLCHARFAFSCYHPTFVSWSDAQATKGKKDGLACSGALSTLLKKGHHFAQISPQNQIPLLFE